jgi:acyl carrier protein
MIEIATLAKILAWVSAAPALAEVAKGGWPKAWTNVEVRFAVEEIGLGFSCNDKSVGRLGVRVLDSKLDEIAYMEGSNSDDACPKAPINIKKSPHYLLREMFQMARCKREFERTESTDFVEKYQWHRSRVVFLWENPIEPAFEQRIVELIAETLVDVEKSSITLDARLVEDLGADDEDFCDLEALLEQEFNMSLTNDDFGVKYQTWGSSCGMDLALLYPFPAWVTVGDVVACIWTKTSS